MQADKSQASAHEPGTVDARQQLLGAAMASGSRSRMGGGQGRRKHSSRLRLDAVEHVALAARSTGPSSRTVDAARDKQPGALNTNADDLGKQLRVLAHRTNIIQAELLDALGRFDELEGWRADGAKNCARWICSELGVGRSLAYSQLFVARKLRELPIIAALFGDGELSWSKVQALTRIATLDDERALAIMALDLDANTVQQICDEYRWGKSGTSATDDAERDRERYERRSLSWSHLPDGSLAFRAVLPPDMAANLIACLEHQESLEFDQEPDATASEDGGQQRRSSTQRRADSLVSMGEASLEAAGDGVSTADRFQVVVHIDAEALEAAADDVARDVPDDVVERTTTESAPVDNPAGACAEIETGSEADPLSDTAESSADLDESVRSQPKSTTRLDDAASADTPLPLPIRAAIAGIGGISPSTARRLACDGSLITVIMKNGEPLSIGRKTRRWSPATRRAILARDGGCTFPGCGSTRNLDIHHVDGWALGGETSVATGAALCRSCHTRVHDEGWRIRRIPDGEPMKRHPEATRLLDQADDRTRDVTRVLDARRSTFRFERSSQHVCHSDAWR